MITPGDGVDMAVEDPGNLLAKSGDLMEVCGEKRDGLDLRGDVFRDGPSQPEAVVGRGSTAKLVNEDEAVLGGRTHDVGRLKHLSHESRNSYQLTSLVTNTFFPLEFICVVP